MKTQNFAPSLIAFGMISLSFFNDALSLPLGQEGQYLNKNGDSTDLSNTQLFRGSRTLQGKDDRSKEKGPNMRECTIDENRDEVEFKCKVKSETDEDKSEIKDRIEFNVKTNDNDIVVKVECKEETETSAVETKSKTQFEVAFDRIIEYRKNETTATSDAYDWVNDEVVQSFDFGRKLKMDFSDITTSEDGIVSQFSVSTTESNKTETSTIPMKIGFEFIISRVGSGEAVSANKMDITFYLEDFPWASSDTFVALVSTIETENGVGLEYDDGKKNEKEEDLSLNIPASISLVKDTINMFGDAFDGVGVTPVGNFSWTNTADIDVDGIVRETIMVVTTSPPSEYTRRVLRVSMEKTEQLQQIAFSFVGNAAKGASNINWRSVAGIDYHMSDSSSGNNVDVCDLDSSEKAWKKVLCKLTGFFKKSGL